MFESRYRDAVILVTSSRDKTEGFHMHATADGSKIDLITASKVESLADIPALNTRTIDWGSLASALASPLYIRIQGCGLDGMDPKS